jgi:hypothetical protein
MLRKTGDFHMTKPTTAARLALAAIFSLAGMWTPSVPGAQVSTGTSNPQGEFFIISSVNLKKRDLFVKAPTEVTEEMVVTPKTVIVNEQGKRIPLSEVRAGNTVYVVARKNAEGVPEVVRLQEGPMTVAVLHSRYLKHKE